MNKYHNTSYSIFYQAVHLHSKTLVTTSQTPLIFETNIIVLLIQKNINN